MISKSVGKAALVWGGFGTLFASVFHIAVWAGGPDWINFSGVPEFIKQASNTGDLSAPLGLLGIIVMLAIWSAYGFSGAGKIRPLFILEPIILLIALILLFWGIIGVPILHLADWEFSYSIFHTIAALYISIVGFCYLLGYLSLKNAG